jgi:hypothetical protein
MINKIREINLTRFRIVLIFKYRRPRSWWMRVIKIKVNYRIWLKIQNIKYLVNLLKKIQLN